MLRGEPQPSAEQHGGGNSGDEVQGYLRGTDCHHVNGNRNDNGSMSCKSLAMREFNRGGARPSGRGEAQGPGGRGGGTAEHRAPQPHAQRLALTVKPKLACMESRRALRGLFLASQHASDQCFSTEDIGPRECKRVAVSPRFESTCLAHII